MGGIFTYILTAAGTLYGWRNPFFGLMVYYAFAILRPAYLWHWAWGGAWNAPRFSFYVGLSTLVGWILLRFGDWSAMRRISIPMIGLVVYLLSGMFAGTFLAVSPARAWQALDVQWKIVLMAFLTITLVHDARTIRILAWVIFLSVGYLAYNFNMLYLEHPGFVWSLYLRGFGGIDNNGVAMVMVMAVPLAFFLGIHAPKWWAKALCFFGAACAIHVVLFSYSRGGQLGLIMVGVAIFVVAMIMLPRKGLTIALAVIFVAISLRLAGDEVRERFWTIFVDASERDASAASRFDTWAGGWACMKANPLGVGPRNFNLVSNQYGLPFNKSVHNLFLQTGADYGFIGMFGLMTFYFGTVWQCLTMTWTRTARRLVWPRYFGHMVLISLIGFLVCSTFIGMEAVEIGYIVGLLGLCTVAYVRRVEAVTPVEEESVLPELVEVPEQYGGRAPDPLPA